MRKGSCPSCSESRPEELLWLGDYLECQMCGHIWRPGSVGAERRAMRRLVRDITTFASWPYGTARRAGRR